jgi:hypothetical protein
MKRKMTFLALAGKWVFLGSRGLRILGAGAAMRDDRAMEPRPTEQRLKKWRRV